MPPVTSKPEASDFSFVGNGIEGGRGTRFEVLVGNGLKLSHGEFIDGLRQSPALRAGLSQALASTAYPAFFWELPALVVGQLDSAFECVVLDSSVLAAASPDSDTFAGYFDGVDKDWTTFPNLGGDARLLVPSQVGDASCYTHLASFVRRAPVSQQQSLWQGLGDLLNDYVGDKPLWLSTCGLGVYWLHIRLDSYPKYYSYRPYAGDRDEWE